MTTDREQKPRTPRGTKPLSVFAAAEKMCAIIGTRPTDAEVKERILKEIAVENIKRQKQLDAIAMLVPETERDKLSAVLLARLDGDLCGFRVTAAENDPVPSASRPSFLDDPAPGDAEVPRGAAPYEPGPAARAARGGR